MKKRVGLGRQRLQDERDERIRVRKRGTAGFGGSSLTSGASAGIVTAAISFARRSNASEIVPGLRSVQNSKFFEMTDFLEPPTGMGRKCMGTVTILAVGCIFIRCRGDLAPLSREKRPDSGALQGSPRLPRQSSPRRPWPTILSRSGRSPTRSRCATTQPPPLHSPRSFDAGPSYSSCFRARGPGDVTPNRLPGADSFNPPPRLFDSGRSRPLAHADVPTFPLHAPLQDPSVTASAGQGANDNPFETGGSQPPAPAPAPAAPAPTSTFGAYDTGAYGGGGAGASAYSASSSYGGVGGGAYDVRPLPSQPNPERE